MLYILPPPSAKPPSVWDLIINFHRKGCQEAAATSSSTNPKKLLKFDCRETNKSQRTWCKTSPSDQSHVSIYRRRDLKSTLAIVISFTFSRAKPDTVTRKFLSFSTQNETFFFFDFPHSHRHSNDGRVCWGKWKEKKFSPFHTWRNRFGELKIVFFFSAFLLHFDFAMRENCAKFKFRRRFSMGKEFFCFDEFFQLVKITRRGPKNVENLIAFFSVFFFHGKLIRHWTFCWATIRGRRCVSAFLTTELASLFGYRANFDESLRGADEIFVVCFDWEKLKISL